MNRPRRLNDFEALEDRSMPSTFGVPWADPNHLTLSFASDGTPTPLGANRISAHEERLSANSTYQLGTQLDNLNHIGVGPVFYGGHRGPDIAKTSGTSRLCG